MPMYVCNGLVSNFKEVFNPIEYILFFSCSFIITIIFILITILFDLFLVAEFA